MFITVVTAYCMVGCECGVTDGDLTIKVSVDGSTNVCSVSVKLTVSDAENAAKYNQNTSKHSTLFMHVIGQIMKESNVTTVASNGV